MRTRRSPALFITATDTGVGKTVATAVLGLALQARGLRVAPFKPFASGAARRRGRRVSTDAAFLKRVLGSPLPIGTINPILYGPPLAPSVADRMAPHRWSPRAIRKRLDDLGRDHDAVLVEGIGGLLVPLRGRYLVADLVRDLGLPLLVVARPGLGTLNHTLLTLEAAAGRRIPVIGVIVSGLPAAGKRDLSVRTNPEELRRQGRAPFLGSILLIPGLDTERGRPGRLDLQCARGVDVDRILAAIRR